MPLFDVSATEATATRKGNPFAAWGHRHEANRVEPIARPSFDAPFQLRPGEAIFTVGSCFARNIEVELMSRGFEVPMRKLFKLPEFAALDPGVINNFGTPSIHNEFAWALGDKEFREDDHIVEVMPGKFADMHVVPSMRPDRRDLVVRQRHAITQAFRTVAQCRVMILTLGLVEVWFDTQTGFYLNVAPRPSMVRDQPERYRLHVLSFDECLEHLEAALQLVRTRANPDIRVLLTVSPVPLMATHRPQDVMVANTYSKSVLRAVAETVCARHDFVTYFPSYESVSLSDRRIAWQDDLVHVTAEIVAVNIKRMTEAFIEQSEAGEGRTAEVADDDLPDAAARARQGSEEGATEFFARFGHHSARSAAFALEHAEYLAERGEQAERLRVLLGAPDGEVDQRLAVARASAYLESDRPDEAIALLDPMATSKERHFAVWNTLLAAACAAGDVDQVSGVLLRWIRAQPKRAAHAYTVVGRWKLDKGEPTGALGFLEQALNYDPSAANARSLLVDALIVLGRRENAREVFAAAPAPTLEDAIGAKLYDRMRAKFD